MDGDHHDDEKGFYVGEVMELATSSAPSRDGRGLFRKRRASHRRGAQAQHPDGPECQGIHAGEDVVNSGGG